MFLAIYFQNIVDVSNISVYLYTVLLLILINKTKDIKYDRTSIKFALIFSFMFTLGNLSKFDFQYTILSFIIVFIGWSLILNRFIYLLDKILKKANVNEKNDNKIPLKRFMLISSIVGFVFFIPNLLRYYPGILTYDSEVQLKQVIGALAYSNHHPIVHTMIIKLFFSIGYTLSGDMAVGVLAYTLFQMFVASITFSYVVYILYKNNIKSLYVALVWIFFFMFPFNQLYAITMWKDIIFSYLILVTCVYLWNHYYNNLKWSLKSKILFSTLSILICLMRSNGLYAYIFLIVVMFIIYREEFKELAKPIIAALICILLVKGPIMRYFKVTPPDLLESLSIPIQQLVYVVKQDENISKSELNEIKKILDYDKLMSYKEDPISYNVSDSTKNNIRDNNGLEYLEKNKLKFLKIWLNVGFKNPVSYVKAFVLQTYGYWYHNYGPFWVYATYYPADMKSGVSPIKVTLTNKLGDRLTKIVDGIDSLAYDAYTEFWSLAMSFYVVLISLYIAIRKNNNVLPYLLPIDILLTLLIATPVASEFRYAYAIFISAPILLISSLSGRVL